MKQKSKIPKGWVEARLKDIGTFDKGIGISKEQTSIVGYPCVRYGEIYTKYNFKIKNFISFIPKEISLISKQILKGDILFTGSGETAEEIAKCVACLHEGIAYAGGDIIIFKINDKKQNSLFYSYFFNTIGRKQINRLAEGNSVVHIYPEELSNINIILPPIKEQEKIVEILELWNKAIETTKKLIEQKKLQKKYLMQKLLTGKIRLKGFKDKWIKTNLGKISIMQSGGTPSTKKQEYFDGNILWASVSDMSSSKKYIDSTEKTISEKGLKNSNAKLFPKGTILFAMYASIGEVCITKVPMTTSQAILSICCSDQLYNEYLYYCLLLYKKIFISLGQTGTQSNLNKGMVENIVLHLPKYNEQKAIANILSTADNQIKMLEQKLLKLELEKKGLMQKLLTGQIRV